MTVLRKILYLVVDQETYGVITIGKTESIANAVAAGFLNSSLMTISYVGELGKEIADYTRSNTDNLILVRKTATIHSGSLMTSTGNVAKSVLQTASGKQFDFELMVNPSEGWLKKRTLGNIRSSTFAAVEAKCLRYTTKFQDFCNLDIFHAFMLDQLNKCNIQTNSYTDAIKEWASIAQITPRTAYEELRMKFDTMGMTVLRVQAVWEKYVYKINQAYDSLTFDELLADVENDLRAREI